MIPSTDSEDRPAYDILALKTVEMLDIVNLTRQLLIEKYNNDQTMWLEAMFRILMIKNSTFLSDERSSSVKDPNIDRILKDKMLEMYRISDEQNFWSFKQRLSSTSDVFDPFLRSQLHETSSTLIASFRVFTNFLLQTKFDMTDEISNLQTIGKNIEKYVQRSSSEPEKTKSAASKANKDNVDVEVDSIETNYQVPVVINRDLPPTPAEISVNDRICDICGDVITVFNNDEDFSLTLHEQELKHKKAVRKKLAPGKSNASSAQDETASSFNQKIVSGSDEEMKIRASILDKIGPIHAKFFNINAVDDFYCLVCKCKVMSMNNIVTHVQGKPHTRSSGVKDYEAAESETESRSAPANTESDSTEDTVFRIGTSIPVKSLF